MNRLLALGASLFLAAFLVACGATPQSGDTAATDAAASEVVAEAGDIKITAGELDAWIKNQLFESQTRTASDLYQLRNRFLAQLLTERVIEREAQSRGVTAEQVVADEVAALGPVTDAEIEEFFTKYQDRMEDAALEDVREPIEALLTSRREAEAIEALRERANIVVMIEAPRVDIAPNGPAKGSPDAKVTIVEFSDFQCPYCQRVLPTMDKVLERYPDDVRLIYRHLPLRSHSRARPAAIASVCADAQDKFWGYHDVLFANNRALTDEDLRKYATDLELDMAAFDACLADSAAAGKVAQDEKDASAAGVSSTPAFLVNGILVSGAQPPEAFFEIIDKELGRDAEAAAEDAEPAT